jgi:hypothetical protein
MRIYGRETHCWIGMSLKLAPAPSRKVRVRVPSGNCESQLFTVHP